MMKYLHNGIWFYFIKRFPTYDLYGKGPLRLMINRTDSRVIAEFIVNQTPNIIGNKNQ